MGHHSRVKGCQKSEHIQANDRDKRARHGRRREIKSSAKRTKSSTTATMIICKLTNWTRRGCHHRHGPSLDGEHSNDGEHTTKPNLPDAKPSTRREQRLRLAVTITRVLLASKQDGLLHTITSSIPWLHTVPQGHQEDTSSADAVGHKICGTTGPSSDRGQTCSVQTIHARHGLILGSADGVLCKS